MKPKAFITGMLRLPIKALTAAELSTLRSRLTLERSIYMVGQDGETVEQIKTYFETSTGYICVPRSFNPSLERFDVVDRTTRGVKVEFPRCPQPDPKRVGQDTLMASAVAEVKGQGDTIVRSGTGTGKTVIGLHVAAKLGRQTLILVEKTKLRDQWIERIMQHLGLKRDDIGIIQGAKNTSKGKAITVAMMQTIRSKRFKSEDFDDFGLTIYDEVHKVGAPTLNPLFRKFRARYRLGLSATPHRKDGLDNVLTLHFGEREHWVVGTVREQPINIYTYRYGGPMPSIDNRAIMANVMAKNTGYNTAMAHIIEELWLKGRDIVGLSDRIDQLRAIQSRLIGLGVPEKRICLFTGKTDKAEVERGIAEADIFLATYGVFSEAIDIPRLSAGIDLTPRTDLVQSMGRVRRPLPDKPHAVWVLPYCVQSSALSNSYYARLRSASRMKLVNILNNWNEREWSYEESKRIAKAPRARTGS